MSGWQRRAWLDGDWDVAAGQFFDEFSWDRHVIDDFDPKLATSWMAAMDYGFSHYNVVLLAAIGPQGQIWIVDEHAARKWLPIQHAQAIRAMLDRHGLKPEGLRRFVAGADIFTRESTGDSVAAHYQRLGLYLRRASMDRLSGWATVLRLLA